MHVSWPAVEKYVGLFWGRCCASRALDDLGLERDDDGYAMTFDGWILLL